MACRQDLNLLEGFGCAMRRLARTERSVGHRLSPRRERTELECNVKNEYDSVVAPLAADPNFAFSSDDTRILIETPDKTVAEYVGSGRAATTGRTAHHLFTGYLVAKAGRIKLLREPFNPLTMAQAQLPNGVADIGPSGDQVHSF
jgi:hypothetical protein